jgi:REP element-mobilizing transposase RayT
MPSTHLSLHYHIVFSTKERRHWIDPAWRTRLHAFLGGAARTCGGIPEAVGGTSDHVHLLLGLKATHRLSDVMRDVKAASSGWVHEVVGQPIFSWQDGYGAFSVSANLRSTIRRYIDNQEEHHRRVSFMDEYRRLLERSGVGFDERYLW